jgi:hypothetical protein
MARGGGAWMAAYYLAHKGLRREVDNPCWPSAPGDAPQVHAHSNGVAVIDAKHLTNARSA